MKAEHFPKVLIYPDITMEFLKLVISGTPSKLNYNRVQMFLIILEFIYEYTVFPTMANIRHPSKKKSHEQQPPFLFCGTLGATGEGWDVGPLPAACAPAHSSCSQTLLCLLLNRAGR